MICQVAASTFMSVSDAAFYASIPDESSTFTAQTYEDHILSRDIPLTVAQFLITAVIIYLLVILSRLTTNMVDKDDPFSNIFLIALIVMFVDSQRLVFKILDLIFMAQKSGGTDSIIHYPRLLFNEMILTRYTTVSMEMLFVIIPLRHNFLLHQVEI